AYIASGSHIAGAVVNGSSESGTGIRTDGEVWVTDGASLNSSSVHGTDLDISGSLIHDPDSTIHAGTISGGGSIHESLSAEGQSAALNAVRRQGAVNAQTGREVSHSGGEPPAILRGYRLPAAPVSVQVCTDEGCSDIAMPDSLTAMPPQSATVVWYMDDGSILTCLGEGDCVRTPGKP
ncbi:hypothetical protein YY63_24660, partial [Salmonella enterica subsp. enterica]|nr:hypothetical protein [Salmonella enterica subsp. enterica serovar Oranienburg]